MLKSLPSSFWISTAGFKFGIFHGEFRMSGRFAWSGLWRICSCYPWNMFEVSSKMYHYYRQHIYCAKKDKIAVLLVRVKITALNQTSWYQSHEQLRQLLGRLLFYVDVLHEKKNELKQSYKELKYIPKKIGFGSTYCSKETLKNLHILCSIRKPM